MGREGKAVDGRIPLFFSFYNPSKYYFYEMGDTCILGVYFCGAVFLFSVVCYLFLSAAGRNAVVYSRMVVYPGNARSARRFLCSGRTSACTILSELMDSPSR